MRYMMFTVLLMWLLAAPTQARQPDDYWNSPVVPMKNAVLYFRLLFREWKRTPALRCFPPSSTCRLRSPFRDGQDERSNFRHQIEP